MKTQLTQPQISALAEAVKATGARLFTQQSSDPKHNAQRALSGITHYADDDTLKWHKARILSTAILAEGLLFRIAESCALDMNNTKRGTRCVVFDVFGTAVYRPDLENTFKTSDKARTVAAETEIDLVAHYREAIKSRLHWLTQDAAKMETALSLLAVSPVAVAA